MGSIKNILLLIVCLFLFNNCAKKNPDLVQLGILSSNLINTYALVSNETKNNSTNFSEEDKKVLQNIDIRVKILIEKFSTINDGKVLSDVELYSLYKDVKILYIEARLIVKKYYINFPEKSQEILIKFDNAAIDLDGKITYAQLNSNNTTSSDTILQIESFVLLTIKILVPILLA